jgi:hypothetical protein
MLTRNERSSLFAAASVTQKKVYLMRLTPDVNVIKLFFFVTDDDAIS